MEEEEEDKGQFKWQIDDCCLGLPIARINAGSFLVIVEILEVMLRSSLQKELGLRGMVR